MTSRTETPDREPPLNPAGGAEVKASEVTILETDRPGSTGEFLSESPIPPQRQSPLDPPGGAEVRASEVTILETDPLGSFAEFLSESQRQSADAFTSAPVVTPETGRPPLPVLPRRPPAGADPVRTTGWRTKLLWAGSLAVLGFAVVKFAADRQYFPLRPPSSGTPTASATPPTVSATPSAPSAPSSTPTARQDSASPVTPDVKTTAPDVRPIAVAPASRPSSASRATAPSASTTSVSTPSESTAAENAAPVVEPVGTTAFPPDRPVLESVATADLSLLDARPSLPAVTAVPPVGFDNRGAIQRVLDAYEQSYDRLDASSAALIWRGVDTRALARAFGSLSTQDLSFDQCDVSIDGAHATALCHGSLRYTRRVGAPTPHEVRVSWTINLEQNADRWVIASVTAN